MSQPYYVTAQQAIDGIRLKFGSKKNKPARYEKLHPSQKSGTDQCDCCGKTSVPANRLAKIDSGQVLCQACLRELRKS
jgi:hypothetical protein